MEILTIAIGLIGLALGVKILKRLSRIQRLLEQPVARKVPQEMRVRLGMRSQRDTKKEGGQPRKEGEQKNEGDRSRNRGDRNRGDRNRGDRNRGDRNRGRNERDGQGAQRRRDRFAAPSEVLGNGVEEKQEAPVVNEQASAASAPSENNGSNRPPLAPRGGDRKADAAVSAAAAPASVVEKVTETAAPAANSNDGVRFGRRTVVKRSPELDDAE